MSEIFGDSFGRNFSLYKDISVVEPKKNIRLAGKCTNRWTLTIKRAEMMIITDPLE